METKKKYYWLRLKENFFDQDEIKIIDGLKNGKEYLVFYMKLMCLSIKSEGLLRINESIPYDEETLASATHTDFDVVRSAIELLIKLKLVEIFDDKSLYLNNVQALIGKEMDGDERRLKDAERQRRHRAALKRKKAELLVEDNHPLELPRDASRDMSRDSNVTCHVENRDKRLKNEELEDGRDMSDDFPPELEHERQSILAYYKSAFGVPSECVKRQLFDLVGPYTLKEIRKAIDLAREHDPKYPMRYIQSVISIELPYPVPDDFFEQIDN